jgi:DNA-directed RNA polymerase subunit RPC12/RpoP
MISAGPIDEVISEFYKIITKDTNIRCLDCNILVKKNQTVQAGCKHPFCKPCLKKFFKLKLEKSKPTRPIRIHCKRCSRPFPDDFIISYLDASDKEKFKSSLTISSSTSEKPVQLTQDKPVQLTQGKPVQLTQDKPVQLTQDKPASKEKIRLPCGDEHLVDLLRTQFEKQIQEGDFRFKCPKGCNKRLSLSSLKRSMCNSSISLDVILKGLKGEVILFTCPFCGKEYSQDMKSEKLVCSLCEVIFCTGCEKLSYKFQRGEMHHQACYFSSNS